MKRTTKRQQVFDVSKYLIVFFFSLHFIEKFFRVCFDGKVFTIIFPSIYYAPEDDVLVTSDVTSHDFRRVFRIINNVRAYRNCEKIHLRVIAGLVGVENL